MNLGLLRGVAEAQRVTRAVIHEVADRLAVGTTEREAVAHIEDGLTRAGVRSWLHTPYAWWGERTRFSGFHDWEPDALPTERRLEPGEAWILDAAPFVDGHPADYALSGTTAEADSSAAEEHASMLGALETIKTAIASWARDARVGCDLYDQVGSAVRDAGYEPIHPRYPGHVLGHSFDVLTGPVTRLPRILDGFQLPLLGGYGLALLRHHLGRAPYPLINDRADEPPRGLYAVEPHLGTVDAGAKFESILLIDGDETRWLDPALFGDAVG